MQELTLFRVLQINTAKIPHTQAGSTLHLMSLRVSRGCCLWQSDLHIVGYFIMREGGSCKREGADLWGDDRNWTQELLGTSASVSRLRAVTVASPPPHSDSVTSSPLVPSVQSLDMASSHRTYADDHVRLSPPTWLHCTIFC